MYFNSKYTFPDHFFLLAILYEIQMSLQFTYTIDETLPAIKGINKLMYASP